MTQCHGVMPAPCQTEQTDEKRLELKILLSVVKYSIILSKRKDMLEFVKCIIAIIVVYGIFTVLGIGCPIKYMTGVSCAGCGMTRAWFYLLQGDIERAFSYHPLFVIPVLFVILVLFKKKIPKSVYKGSIAVMIALFMIVYIARMLNPNDTIVVFNIEAGFIWRTYNDIVSFVREIFYAGGI